MTVFEVDETKALWLALRADAHVVLARHLQVDQTHVRSLEEKLFRSIVQDDNITPYHMKIYREIVSTIIMAPLHFKKSILENFKESISHLYKKKDTLFVCKQMTTNTQPNSDTKSQRLFHQIVRPKLMALAADTKIDLPACPNCQTKEYMTLVGIQTRSGDEAETLFPKCMKCKLLMKDHGF